MWFCFGLWGLYWWGKCVEVPELRSRVIRIFHCIFSCLREIIFIEGSVMVLFRCAV